MKVWNKMMILAGLGLSLTACQSPTSQVKGETHHYTVGKECPALLVMKVGETLVFNAPENPSTGFQWQLMQPLKLFKIEESYLASETEEGVVGAGGEKAFRFTAEKPGQELIELSYVRPWEAQKQLTQPSANEMWQCRVRIA